jgi:hypothetical protein
MTWVFCVPPLLEAAEPAPKSPDAQGLSEEDQKAHSDLQALHRAMSAYLADQGGVWPQAPTTIANDFEESLEWLMKILAKHGALAEHWGLIPTGKPSEAASGRGVTVSYLPSSFDELPLTPYRWAGQPWFVSLGSPSWIITADGRILRSPELNELPPPGKTVAKEAFPGASLPVPLEKIPAPLHSLARVHGWK